MNPVRRIVSNEVNLRSLGEFGLIRRTKKLLGRSPRVIRGIGDDAAVLPYTRKEYLLFTTDAVLEGHHFTLKKALPYFQKAAPYQIGWKALGVNISDIAAMGGVPRYAVVALGARKNLPVSFYDQITKGIKALARRFGVAVVGGDTDRSEKLSITIAMIGTVEKSRCVLRSGAKVGDVICVTGSLGGSRQGRHLTFIPKVREARTLTKEFHLTSMIDLSDGLAGDLGQICRESRVGAVIEKEAIPVSKGATLRSALNDGEDFELLFTLSPREAKRLLQKDRLGFRVTEIGRIVAKGRGIRLKTGEKTISLKGGYRHF